MCEVPPTINQFNCAADKNLAAQTLKLGPRLGQFLRRPGGFRDRLAFLERGFVEPLFRSRQLALQPREVLVVRAVLGQLRVAATSLPAEPGLAARGS